MLAARSAAFLRHRPVEERQTGAGSALRVAIEQVVSTHVVLIYGALHQPHTEGLGVEVMVLPDRRRDSGQVMDAGKLHRGVLRVLATASAPRP